MSGMMEKPQADPARILTTDKGTPIGSARERELEADVARLQAARDTDKLKADNVWAVHVAECADYDRRLEAAEAARDEAYAKCSALGWRTPKDKP